MLFIQQVFHLECLVFFCFFFILKITVFELEFDLQDTRLGPEVT